MKITKNQYLPKQFLRMLKSDYPPEIMYASNIEEFFYRTTDEAVPEGEAVGLDIPIEDGVEFVLFSDIYWNPQD